MSMTATGDEEFANLGWQSMRVRNLRCFADSGEVDFARMTLLFGKNSSGKTTLLRAPLLLKQIFGSSVRNEALLTGPDVDFGFYKEMVNNGQVSRDVRLTATIASGGAGPLPGYVFETNPALVDLFARMRVDVVIHWNRRSGQPQYQSLTFSNPDTNRKVISFDRTGPAEFDVNVTGRRRPVHVNTPLSPQSIRFAELAFRETGNEDREQVALSYLMFQLGWNLERSGNDIVHVKPLRQEPRRSYIVDRTYVADTGESAVSILRSGQGLKDIRRALQMLGMANSINLVKLAPGFVAITLQDSRTGRVDNLVDVGFGVSQVLPILATLATAKPHTTVLIEQPELHLHPEAQGKLADVLYFLASPRKLKLVIETHSEHLLLRLQRRVAEGTIRPEELAINFVDLGKVKRADIDRYGQVDNSAIPKGFFEDDWHDLMLMTKAAAEAVSRGD